MALVFRPALGSVSAHCQLAIDIGDVIHKDACALGSTSTILADSTHLHLLCTGVERDVVTAILKRAGLAIQPAQCSILVGASQAQPLVNRSVTSLADSISAN